MTTETADLYSALSTDARELVLWAENTFELQNQFQSIIKNIQAKIKRGVYDPALAPKLWRYWTDAASKSYTKEFGSRGQAHIFGTGVRQEAADYFAASYYQAIIDGEYN